MGRQDESPEGQIPVECYSGFKDSERPVAFGEGEGRRTVEEVIDNWAGEDHDYYKVLADDQVVYILRYDRSGGHWTLERVMGRRGPL